MTLELTTYDSKFLSLNDEIPPVPSVPQGLNFLLWQRVGNLLFLAEHGPTWGGEVRYKGKVGKELSVEEGYAAARLTILNLLQSARQALGSLDKVVQAVEVFGMVNSASGFTNHPRVLNGCSDLLVIIFGEAGKHVRCAVGVAELPFNIAVEIKMSFLVSDE